MGQQTQLSIRGLRKVYKDVVAVDGVDLDVYGGECVGILGPNGAGKTTTIEICEGLKMPDAGSVSILGMDWHRHPQQIRQRIGVQLQETQLEDRLTVQETLALFRSFYDRGPTIDHLLARVTLEEKRRARISELSGGQKQRVAMACALVGDPDLLFLDEPTTGLDPQSRRQLWSLLEELKNAGRTTILTTHYMDEAERLCDRVAIMDQGRIIALGTPRELISSLGVEHIIEFALPESAPPLNSDEMQALQGVGGVQLKEGRYTLSVAELHSTVPAVLEHLRTRGLPLSELRTHSATLEDVFVSLTGRHLRDE